MKRFSLLFLIFTTTALINVHAETESIDLKALAKKARPAVMLLVVSARRPHISDRQVLDADDYQS